VAKRPPQRASVQPELLFTTKKAGSSPEEIARKAVARRPTTPFRARQLHVHACASSGPGREANGPSGARGEEHGSDRDRDS
jgi:hypothetical protein